MTDLVMRFDGIGAVARWIGRYREARARRSALRALEQVDAATLRDIGMSQAELMSVCFGNPAGRRRNDA